MVYRSKVLIPTIVLLLLRMQLSLASFPWNYALFPPPDVDYSYDELCKKVVQLTIDEVQVNVTRMVSNQTHESENNNQFLVPDSSKCDLCRRHK